VKQQSDRERAVLKVLFKITQQLNEDAPLEQLLSEVAQAATSVTLGDAATVMVLDDPGESLLCRATFGMPWESVRDITFSTGDGVAGWVVQEGKLLRLDDAPADPRFKIVEGQENTIRSLLCVPLMVRRAVIGVLSVTSSKTGVFDEADEKVLSFLAASIVKDIENARLYRLSVTDSLTRVYNRQYLSERMPAEMDRKERYGGNLCLILLDADHFKDINDTYGHRAGDSVLQNLARFCKMAVREVDSVVRYGGEEFLLLLPQTTLQGAVQVAERLRTEVENHRFRIRDQSIQLTISAGVAEHRSTEDTESFLTRTDAALYDAKNSGRNRICVALDPSGM
jgi:diguanylate cyclase (GGDEF)-like protein